MKCKSSSSDGSLTIKLDISKAYDRVEWVFLERVMLQMGFSDDWVRRIMSCITSVQFCFKLNGSIFGNLVPSWGLRQGDPISPYLFLICADAFFSLLSRAECSNIANIISTYERASSQKVNYEKTQISFSKNVLPSLRAEIASRLTVTEVLHHDKYLGLPNIMGRLKKSIFACIKERI
ncbi:uncharacterized protein LOC130828447 [Amaranthus tricolor]|uniref:uncharacterized protein LOC130828447 n=1 Tax=Amaranthus tricolor TaxID=29722 RepID=UPI00258636F4|nr:uncharacterized protein LOC130828447 [Amaranthus tricolor]